MLIGDRGNGSNHRDHSAVFVIVLIIIDFLKSHQLPCFMFIYSIRWQTSRRIALPAFSQTLWNGETNTIKYGSMTVTGPWTLSLT